MIAATLNDNIGGLASRTTDGEDRSGRVTGVASNSSGGAKQLLPFPVGTSSTSSAAVVVTRGGDGETVARQRRAESPTLTAGSPTSLGDSMFVTDALRCWSAELRRLLAMTRSVNRVINLDRRRRQASKTCQNSQPKLSQRTVTQPSSLHQRSAARASLAATFVYKLEHLSKGHGGHACHAVRPTSINLTDSSRPGRGRSLWAIATPEKHGRVDHYTSISVSRGFELCGKLRRTSNEQR